MQNINNPKPKKKLNYKHRDDRLLNLQKSLTKKISQTKDEGLIKHYLQQVYRISQQRLALQKGEGYAKP